MAGLDGSNGNRPGGAGAGARSASAAGPGTNGLSTDYLNHYSEILMLIEMAPWDAAVVDELSGWRPIGYREHFLRSPLRCAAAALAAYEALPDEACRAFELNIAMLDDLAGTVPPEHLAA